MQHKGKTPPKENSLSNALSWVPNYALKTPALTSHRPVWEEAHIGILMQEPSGITNMRSACASMKGQCRSWLTLVRNPPRSQDPEFGCPLQFPDQEASPWHRWLLDSVLGCGKQDTFVNVQGPGTLQYAGILTNTPQNTDTSPCHCSFNVYLWSYSWFGLPYKILSERIPKGISIHHLLLWR